MFNTYNVRSGPSHVSVHEHKAPTDDSIRLFGELKEKAEKSIVDSFILRSNKFHCEISVSVFMLDMSYQLWYSFDLNGVKHQNKFAIPVYTVKGRDGLIEEIGKRFVTTLVEDVFDKNYTEIVNAVRSVS